MDKNMLLEILEEWNFWRQERSTGKQRVSYLQKVEEYLQPNVIVSLIGVRRAGKSYVMKQVIANMIKNGVESRNILYVNFEERRFTSFSTTLLDEIFDVYVQTLEPTMTPFVFLDEIQNIPLWERWARSMHELGKAKIVISGSSANLLSGELGTVLTGRHLDIFIFPLDFKEILAFQDIVLKDALDIVSKKTEIQKAFQEYFISGGFPEVVLTQEKKPLLLMYFDDIITKDIEKRYAVHEKAKLQALGKWYLSNISSKTTFNALKEMLEMSPNTVEKFTAYLEEAHLLFFLKRFSFKVKEQEKAARKVYAIDVGLANSIGFSFSANKGKIAENIVAITLRKKSKEDPAMELYYWQDSSEREIDFVVKKGEQIEQLIQVCWNPEEKKTKEREIRALLKASEELGCESLLIITENKEGKEEVEWFGRKGSVHYIPLWKWLLS